MSKNEEARALAQKGETNYLARNYDAALVYFNLAIEKNDQYAWAYAHRGQVHRHKEDFLAAVKDFDKAVELEKDYVWAYAHRGETKFMMGKHHEAAEDLNKALKVEPKYTWGLAHLGQVYRFLGEEHYQDAIQCFTLAIEQNSNYAWAIAYRSTIHALMHNYEEAWADLLNAIKIDPVIPLRGSQATELGADIFAGLV